MNLFLTILSFISLVFGLWCVICTICNVIFFRAHHKKAKKTTTNGNKKVSVVIPARNEEEHLPRLLDSLLNQDYPNYEVVVIDDQSTDSTWSIIQSYMEKSDKIRGFKNDGNKRLSPYGKINALLNLIPYAEGDILLCTDADTVHSPSSISIGVKYMEEGNLDILSGFPYQGVTTYGGGVVTAAMIFSNVVLPHFFLNPIQFTPFAIGIGQYVMMNKESYMEVGGYGAMPQSVCDDIGIIKHFMRHKKIYGFRNLSEEVSCKMYSDRKSAFRGIERSLTDLFPINVLMVTLLLIAVTLLMLISWTPLFTPLYLMKGENNLLFLALLGWLLTFSSWTLGARETGFWKTVSISGSLSVTAICAMYVHGIYRKITGKGFDWKGRKV